MNYIEYFIPKYQHPFGPLPSTGNEERDKLLEHLRKLYANEGLSTENTPESLFIESAVIGKPLEVLGKGLLKGIKTIIPKINTSIAKILKRNPNGLIAEYALQHEPSNQVQKDLIKDIVLPDYAKPNYQGDHLLLVKDRLANGGFERIENAAVSKEIALNSKPTVYQLKPGQHPGFFASTGLFYKLPLMYKLEPYAGTNSEITYAVDKNFIEKLLKNNQAIAHEFEHYIHTPKVSLPESAVDPRYISSNELRKYFTESNNTEIAARFGQLKNYFGLKEGLEITPEMWEYAKLHYITDTRMNNNMTEFFNLRIDDLKKFLDWGNKHALSISAPISTVTITSNKKHENK